MPFIKPERREPLLTGQLEPTEKGDLTFLKYRPLVEKFRSERRWTTVHNLAKDLFDMNDDQTAKFLAFLEFYIREAHVLEDENLAKNGDVI